MKVSRIYLLPCRSLVFLLLFFRTSNADSLGLSAVNERFERNGFVVLPQFFYKSKLKAWQRFSSDYFNDIFRMLHEKGHTQFPEHSRLTPNSTHLEYAMEEGKAKGFQEIVMRSPGRYELSMIRKTMEEHKIPTIQPLLDELALVIPSFLHVESMDDVRIDYSMIVTTPLAAEQAWHSDGDHYRLDQHMPCHVLNVFIPLVDVVTKELGPTEVFPGSHYATRSEGGVRLRNDQLNPPVAPLLRLGDILIFDYRIIHRGQANLSESNRPVLVLTLSQKWFQDEKNWPPWSLFHERKVASKEEDVTASFFDQFRTNAVTS